MYTLRDVRANAKYDLDEIDSNFSFSWPPEKKIRLTRIACLSLHNIGYIGILADANPEEFNQHLLKAGERWKKLLQNAATESFDVPAKYNECLFGTLAIDNIPLSLELSELSSKKITPLEYDDEFYYSFFLQQYIISGFGENEITPSPGEIHNKLQTALNGLSSTRADICEALINKNSVLLTSTLETLNQEFEEEMETKTSNPSIPPDETMAAKNIWLEGMAIIRLAQYSGIQLNSNFKYIPHYIFGS